VIKFLRRDEGPSDPSDQSDLRVQDKPAAPSPAASPDDGLGVPPFNPGRTNPPIPVSMTPSGQPPVAHPGYGSQPAAGTQSLASRDLRHTQDKETSMARSPFTSSQTPVSPSATPAPAGPGIAFRPNVPRAPEAAERRTLVVGRGISVQGVVQDAERLVVEGTVEATMIHAAELAITQGGVFKGEVEVEEAEIAGTIDGTLTARHALVVRGTGRVLGTARCKRLQVEDGGQITGRIEMLTEDGADAAD
jgi:cytoskeletal protein CcmA (bactofilin family)